jgi:hypothetical protein
MNQVEEKRKRQQIFIVNKKKICEHAKQAKNLKLKKSS